MSKSELNIRLQDTIKNLVNSELSKKETLPENFDSVDVDVYESRYGKMCHIYFLFNSLMSGYEMAVMRPIEIVIKRKIKLLFGDILHGGVYTSIETRKSYNKSIEEFESRLGENKKPTMKVIITESQVEKLISIFEKFVNSESYEGVVDIGVDYDEIMDKFVLNIFFDKKFAIDLGLRFNSIRKKVINEIGMKFMDVTGFYPLLYEHYK